MQTIDGVLFAEMIKSGAASLGAHTQEINDLNVFPIPDGDTGSNMLMTVMGAVNALQPDCKSLCQTAQRVADGMLFSARGNSGVILSQFFEGIKIGFSGLDTADAKAIGNAFRCGTAQAYRSVMTPTEGTVLTVIREATDYACEQKADAPREFLEMFIDEAKRSLARTPELLPVLKKSGVVDSGAAGLIYIVDGMLRAVSGEDSDDLPVYAEKTEELDFDKFDEDSVLEFGYCTELLLRLQNSKTEISDFDTGVMTDCLQSVGDSIVAVRNGSIVKIHIHTMTPDKVLAFCQRYGEFLKVKIENMSLQHNNTLDRGEQNIKERKKYAVVAVASGEGLKQTFIERGADVVVEGGQCMNPSVEDFIRAFDEVNADTVFVFPNNSNIVLTAEQSASLYKKSDVRVIDSVSVGAGYASLSMLDTGEGDTDAIEAQLKRAMEGVVTAEISRCVKDAVIDGVQMSSGDYIGFAGKELLAVNKERFGAVCSTLEKIDFSRYDICILVYGSQATADEAKTIENYIRTNYAGKEVYLIDGKQDVYDYIMIIE